VSVVTKYGRNGCVLCRDCDSGITECQESFSCPNTR
jgi:hypothetical protein